MKLTPKQKAFADEYLKNGEISQTQPEKPDIPKQLLKMQEKTSWKSVEFRHI